MSKSNGILAWTCALVAAVALSPVLIMARDTPSLPRSEDIIHNLVEQFQEAGSLGQKSGDRVLWRLG
jgi:hypothetical protein